MAEKTKNVKKTGAKAKATLKAVKPAVKVCPTVDEVMKRLAKSTIPMNFVKKNNGAWNHQDWLDFLAAKSRLKGMIP